MRDILDLDRYPLDRPDSPEWNDLVVRCRAELAEHGMFNLEGLMHAHVAQAEADALSEKFDSESFLHQRDHNIYFLKKVPGLEDDHPALKRFETSNNTLCGDQARGTAMARLYHWPEFAYFLASVMEKPALHVMDDELAGFNVMRYRQGQTLNWHFDRSEFTTTLLLQSPKKGGEFLYRPDLRTDDDPNYSGVAKLVTGKDDNVHLLKVAPGTLNVFRGKNTAHKVSEVEGDTPRVITVFCYYEQPGMAFTDEERLGFYGRVR